MDRSRSISRPRSVSRSASRPRKSTDPRSPSPIDTYMSARSQSPSRGRPSSSSHPRSLADSRSRSRSSSRSATSRPHHHHNHHHHKNHKHEHGTTTTAHPHGLFKNTAGLLAGIGLATIIAHKAWPKGILHGDAEDWESRPQPTAARRASESHRRHSHSHHRRPSDAAERTVERAKKLRGRGDLVYYEEIVPVRKGEPRRRDLEKRGFERERAPAKGPAKGPARLPYPEHAFPDERFYEPSVSRARAAEKVYR